MLASTADKEEFGKFEWKYFERPASQQAERNNSARITRSFCIVEQFSVLRGFVFRK